MQPPAGTVGDHQSIGRPGDRDAAAMMQPVVIWAEKHKAVDKSLIYLLSDAPEVASVTPS